MHQINLDSRCQAIMDGILKTDGSVKVEDIAKMMNVSKRSVYYDISKINDWLSFNNIAEIQPDRQRGIFIDSIRQERIRKLFEGLTSNPSPYYIFSPEERVAVIVCTIIASYEPVFIETLVEMCSVSRNTILKDLKEVKMELAKYNLQLVSENKNGYEIESGVIKKRAVFLYYLSSIIHLLKRKLVSFIDYKEIERNYNALNQIETELDTEYVDGTLFQLSVLISVVKRKKDAVEIDQVEENNIIATLEYRLVQRFFPELHHTEQIYFTIHLLGARVQVTRSFGAINMEDSDLFKLIKNMVREFEYHACIEFNDTPQLIKNLFMHMNISLYRYRYGIIEGNPLAIDIENNYPELFYITKKVAKSLSEALGYPITNSEVAYLTLHFGGHLRSSGNKKGVARVLLVCPSGISTAQMLQKQLEELSPFMEIIDIVSLKELDEYTGIYDFIISTVEINHKRHVMTVHFALTPMDKQLILSHIFRLKGNIGKRDETEIIFSIIKKYISESNHVQVLEELKEHFNRKVPVKQRHSEEEVQGAAELLPIHHLQIVEGIESWQESITVASKPLLEEGLIQFSFVNAMIESVERFGSYMFLSPEIALAHAKPEDGVIALSMSLLVIRNGVKFPDDANAKIIIVLAPIDNERHLRGLKEIVNFFSEADNTLSLLQSRDIHEAHQMMENWMTTN